ncbi:hypothetical protein SGLAD_v1c03680 [Spiroplasma gladiatoris]|uniref:Uncharacterized protein n=1 Tax=Spiroplasma gladiatoris TaxID=2143 RepID=A0A4P7AHB1_9MOLU|nr:hypothetical protein [Spiroplasma gladiatoris]QBQ07567.1 hypothetical protein SGLAD_v1c03680 [Spiroplasma gladiatoris]
MNFKASDAINLVFTLIGNATAKSILSIRNNLEKRKILSNEIKDFYRENYKKNVKNEHELINLFDAKNWSFSIDKKEIEELKNFFFENFFVKNDYNYYLEHKHVLEEINKIYQKALDNAFVIDKSQIDWKKTIRVIESRFLTWINNKNLKQNHELKEKLLVIMISLNESNDKGYTLKYKNLLNNLDRYKKFVNDYDQKIIENNTVNLQFYNKYQNILNIHNCCDYNMTIDEYLDYENIIKQIKKLPDNGELWDFDFTIVLLKRVFFCSIINNLFTIHSEDVPRAKIEMILSNGGFRIDFSKESLKNLYIALTQNETKIKELIKFSSKRLNLNLIELIRSLIKNLLLSTNLEQFQNYNKEETFNIPNLKVLSCYSILIGKVINFHLSSINETIFAYPEKNSINFEIALVDTLLNFNNKNDIIDILKTNFKEIRNYPSTVIIKSIDFIEYLSNVENI